MKCICCPNNSDRFATNLRRDAVTKNLIWDNARGQDVLIVQTPFGKSAVLMLQELCDALEELDDLPEKFTEIFNGVWACHVSAADKARNKGCVLNGEASTYTVFSCWQDGDILNVYRPQDQAMISAFFDIPLEIHVDISKQIIVEGFIRKREVETGFYSMRFPSELVNVYMDGSLCYRIDDFEIPVTKEMIAQGLVYIESLEKPVMIPKTRGLKII